MQPPAERSAASTRLLTIHGAGGVWGIPSSFVSSVELPDAIATESPPELLALLGVASPASATERARVLVLEVQGQHVQLLVHGALQLADAAASDLLPLPAAVQAITPLLSHLAVIDGKPALFVVSPERLLQAARDVTTALPLNAPHDSARGSSC
jgi:hypothetical protein